jgi:hypothetical protein
MWEIVGILALGLPFLFALALVLFMASGSGKSKRYYPEENSAEPSNPPPPATP